MVGHIRGASNQEKAYHWCPIMQWVSVSSDKTKQIIDELIIGLSPTFRDSPCTPTDKTKQQWHFTFDTPIKQLATTQTRTEQRMVLLRKELSNKQGHDTYRDSEQGDRNVYLSANNKQKMPRHHLVLMRSQCLWLALIRDSCESKLYARASIYQCLRPKQGTGTKI